MNENALKSALSRTFQKELLNSVVFSHSDRILYGIPDMSVTWAGYTSWLELKIYPIKSRGIQDRSMERLARAGRAFYVIYDVRHRRTYVVEPKHLDDPSQWKLIATVISHKAVVEFVRAKHLRYEETKREYNDEALGDSAEAGDSNILRFDGQSS